MDFRKYKIIIGFLLMGSIFTSINGPSVVKATDTYNITTSIDDLWIIKNVDYYHGWLIKWNISSIPTGRVIMSATFNFSLAINGANFDNDLRIWEFSNQTWGEDARTQLQDADDLTTQSGNLNEQTDYTGISGTGWKTVDITNHFKNNYGNGNFSLRVEDPDYLIGTAGGTVSQLRTSNTLHIGGDPSDTRAQVYSKDQSETLAPKLIVILAPIPAGTLQVTYNFPTNTDQTTFVTPQEHWNGTQLLYNMPLYPYEDKTNVTISGISTSYSFLYIHPNSSNNIIDTISSDGRITFNFLNGSIYEVVLDPLQDWHSLHISLFAPDGVGLMWESFQIYINNTRVPYPPEVRIETGYYEYAVKDYFSQTVLEGHFTISPSDPEDVFQNWEVPLYLVSFHNADTINYYLNITRNSITRTFPLPPKGEVTARLYGLSSNVDYSIYIYKVATKDYVDDYTLSMPALPVAQYLNYDNDEQIHFPTYEADFSILETLILESQVAQTQLIILGVFGLLAALIIQRYALLKSLFSKPLLQERRRNR